MKIIRYSSIPIIVLIILCLPGCLIQHDDTKPITRTSAYPRLIDRAKKDKRYIIMHSGIDTYAVASVVVEKSKKEFTVHLNKIDSFHRVNMNNPKLSGEKYAHMYMRDSTSYTLDEPHTLLLKKIARIELVD